MRQLASRLRAAPAPVADLVFVMNGQWSTWILHGICREIEHHSGLACRFHHHPQDGPLPPARAYFISHQHLLMPLLRAELAAWRTPTIAWYTHPSEPPEQAEELGYALRHATHVVAMCSMHADRLAASGVAPDRIHVARGAADPRRFTPHQRGSGVVGFCSAYYERKRPELVLEVVRAMPHRRFLLLGRDWHKWERFAELRALENLEYVEAPYEEYPAHYARMDVFVAPARLEGGPIPLVEAMMSNAVPVASRTGFAPDIIRHGENGFLFDTEAPADTVCALVEQAHALEADVRATVEQLSWEQLTRELLAIVPELAARAPRLRSSAAHRHGGDAQPLSSDAPAAARG